MHRRIMIAIEFRQPDHLLRKAIWVSHMPEQMSLSDKIDLVLLFQVTKLYLSNCHSFCRMSYPFALS